MGRANVDPAVCFFVCSAPNKVAVETALFGSAFIHLTRLPFHSILRCCLPVKLPVLLGIAEIRVDLSEI